MIEDINVLSNQSFLCSTDIGYGKYLNILLTKYDITLSFKGADNSVMKSALFIPRITLTQSKKTNVHKKMSKETVL